MSAAASDPLNAIGVLPDTKVKTARKKLEEAKALSSNPALAGRGPAMGPGSGLSSLGGMGGGAGMSSNPFAHGTGMGQGGYNASLGRGGPTAGGFGGPGSAPYNPYGSSMSGASAYGGQGQNPYYPSNGF